MYTITATCSEVAGYQLSGGAWRYNVKFTFAAGGDAATMWTDGTISGDITFTELKVCPWLVGQTYTFTIGG